MTKPRANRIRLDRSDLTRKAVVAAFAKLNPKEMLHNPVMFVVEVGAVLTTALLFDPRATGGSSLPVFLQIVIWLWFTLLFANFAEALAEGRGKARADSFRSLQEDTVAHRAKSGRADLEAPCEDVPSRALRKGDLVVVSAGELLPCDGEIVAGVASIDESAVTGESAPVVRESGGDRSGVTAGTRVLSDRILVQVTTDPGESFLDRMIALVEGAKRQKAPNEVALNILLVGLTIIFLLVVATLEPFAIYSGTQVSVIYLVALLVCLIPTTIGGLLSAIGIAGMDRLVSHNLIAKSGRAVEAAGDVDVLMLDKTGTITFGNRMAVDFVAAPGVPTKDLAEVAYLTSLEDQTPEGKSVVDLAGHQFGLTPPGGDLGTYHPFSAQTRLSGLDRAGQELRKGAGDAILRYCGLDAIPMPLRAAVEAIADAGGTPLLVARDRQLLGAIHLKDVIKPGMRERFALLRRMGIRTVMITGDNPRTAAAIAAESGVDDFLAEATPEQKLEFIRREQAQGKLVAMCGDGSNDAPALAQANVGLAMHDGTMAARDAANMVDLDSDPTKLIEVAMIGKQLLISRAALTTFSIANDVAKYFAIIPALFVQIFPGLEVLNVMRLATPQSAILSAVIFNALIIVALIPLALRGVQYVPSSAAALLRRNLLLYGVGGLIVPFVGIKLIDLLITHIGLVR